MSGFFSASDKAAGRIFPNRVMYTTSGSWTVPALITTVRVRMVGGGGSLSGNPSTGVSSYSDDGWEREEVIAVTPGAVMPVVIGAAGSNGAGGSTTFAGLIASGGAAQARGEVLGSGTPAMILIRPQNRLENGGLGASGYGRGNTGGSATAGALEIWY